VDHEEVLETFPLRHVQNSFVAQRDTSSTDPRRNLNNNENLSETYLNSKAEITQTAVIKQHRLTYGQTQ